MTTERKRWWRKVATTAVGGVVVAGGLFGIVRATAQPQKEPAAAAVQEQAWTRAAAAAPAVAEVERTPAPGYVTPASGTLPLPSFEVVSGVMPAVPLPPLAGIEPASGPRAPDAGLIDKNALPAIPSFELPKPPTPPAPLPGIQMPPAPPALPPLPGSSAEPPKAPMTPMLPQMPAVPPITPPALPATPTEPMPPMLPLKPDSGLNPTKPGNNLNPASPVAPAVPIEFPPLGGASRETPGTTVERPKPAEPSFGASDKFVFPVPAGRDPRVPTPRDPAMFNFKYAAALAIVGGAMLSAEQARAALPPVVPIVQVKADPDTDKIKRDLDTANDKIKALEKQVAKLTELLTGKKDFDGSVLPSDPGAVEEVKRLKNRIAELDTELKALKTQTALKPAVAPPEAKPEGTVKVVNEYPVEISMVINDKSHRIPPNTKIEVKVPAGDFSYQLLQSGAATTRSVIKDKETVTLRIK